ncbi:complement regulatory protein [Trypanosoma cruzi Dm28c]|uniref:Complement regulatory protein n=2 Tax=Trypanosoma cruzi TaxID=5693 RepID=V5B5S0_TRYCR|nr:complement regulatory protein [Trypanosoma cruzi Dm28c]PBJ73734.1 trans-sialidase [Trypanosoma cruzi cruzi]PWU90951.1 putative trans-sialidase, Group VIII [Trypanosoma cruzi]
MLSRVAAVKAPCTHNRRRVTGSSGRRREGGESEPQRPNMSRRLFTSAVLLLFVVTMCCTGEAAAAGGGKSSIAINPFTGTRRIDATWKDVEINTGSKITLLRVPILVDLQGHVFAIAEACCKDEDKCSEVGFTGIASKYLGLNGDSGSTEFSTADASIFGIDLLKKGSEVINTANGITRPTTVVLGESVYVLLGNYSRTKEQIQGKNEPALLLVKGSLSDEGEKKKIKWNETHLVKPQGKGASLSLTDLIGGGGSGAVMDDGSLVFPMQAKGNDGKSVLLSMRFTPPDKWELPQITPGKGCRDPTLAKWGEDEGDERLFMMAHCAGGYYDVYESTPNGVNWYTDRQPITRVWGNSHNRKGYGVQSGFTTAIIEGKEVMLITAPVYLKDNVKGRLHLWVTDKARVHDVGPVSREDDDAAASSLLIKDNKELISLYENKKDGAYNLVAVRLTEKLGRIKEVVKTWKDLDSALQSCSFGSSATVDLPKKDMCNGPVPTDELVGFLSGNSTRSEWKDEYLGVNAKVHGPAEKRIGVPNGLTFKGSGAWAEWPVGEMGQTVPYYFANNEFTLVATVSIHEVPQSGSIPLIGVRMNDTSSTVLFGLSYTHGKKWLAIAEGAGGAEDVGDWEPNKTYQVGLRMDGDDEWTAIVDGMEIDCTKYNESLFDSHRISHFYIGGDSKHQSATGGHVTVTNVMLYNEKLFGKDLRKLNASKVTIPSPGVEKQSKGQVASTGALVASEPKSEESASYEELTGDDLEKPEEESAHTLVPAASSSTDFAGLSVPELAIASESAGNSREEDNTQLSEEETFQQATLNEDNGSMQRDSEVQTQDPQTEESTEATGVETSPESNDAQPPEKEEEANDMSVESTSPVGVPLSMETATETVDGEHQVQQITELPAENNDVRSTGTVTTGTEESLSLEAGDGNSESSMSSDSSPTPSKSDAEPTSAEDTDDVSRTDGAEVSSEEGEESPQTVDTAPGNKSTTPGETKIPSESNATTPSDTGILLEKGHYSELSGMALFAESTVHGCVSRVFLLLLGLWGIAALC